MILLLISLFTGIVDGWWVDSLWSLSSFFKFFFTDLLVKFVFRSLLDKLFIQFGSHSVRVELVSFVEAMLTQSIAFILSVLCTLCL